MSHIAIWQWMVDNNQEVCLILEDDVIIESDFINKVNKCINDSPILQDTKKWDMWLLGGTFEGLTQIPGETKVARVGTFFSFYSYVMTLHGAKRLLKAVYPIQGHIDVWTSIYSYVHDFRIVCCLNLNIKHNTKVKTEIQTSKGCDICNVEAGYSDTHRLITHAEWNVARTAEVVAVGLICYIIYQRYMRHST